MAGKHYMASARAWAREFFGDYMQRRVDRIVQSRGTAEYTGKPNINAAFGEHIDIARQGKAGMKVVKGPPGTMADVRAIGHIREKPSTRTLKRIARWMSKPLR
jgi:hypothetical protein